MIPGQQGLEDVAVALNLVEADRDSFDDVFFAFPTEDELVEVKVKLLVGSVDAKLKIKQSIYPKVNLTWL